MKPSAERPDDLIAPWQSNLNSWMTVSIWKKNPLICFYQGVGTLSFLKPTMLSCMYNFLLVFLILLGWQERLNALIVESSVSINIYHERSPKRLFLYGKIKSYEWAQSCLFTKAGKLVASLCQKMMSKLKGAKTQIFKVWWTCFHLIPFRNTVSNVNFQQIFYQVAEMSTQWGLE